jgi:hypothetical protein
MSSPRKRIAVLLLWSAVVCLAAAVYPALTTPSFGQENDNREEHQGVRSSVRAVTIPVTIRFRGSPARQAEGQEVPAADLTVREDGEEQRVISVRNIGTTPLTVGVLIQDDVVSSINNEIKTLGDFIRSLPEGSRVMVAYMRNGSLQVRQKFTPDLDKAAGVLRTPVGSISSAPYNPYVEIIEGLKRFDSQPSGRRAMLVISDGLDTSKGLDLASLSLSPDSQRAITDAQRRSVAIYSFYAPTAELVAFRNSAVNATAQGLLQRVSAESGGRAFFQGTEAPVSFDPFLRELGILLTRQLAVTYLSTHPKKGFHRLDIKSTTPGIEIDRPAGYSR